MNLIMFQLIAATMDVSGPVMILLSAALIPVFFLLIFIYRQDKIEPEPKRLLGKLFLLGALSVVSALILETIGEGILSAMVPKESVVLYQFLMNFIVVACSEEGGKRFFLRRGSWNDPAFNYRFDGVVYGVTVSLGFAAAENISYLASYGLQIAPMRALTAIPLHCICGVFMGHYYGQTKFFLARGDQVRTAFYRKASIVIPVLIHGFYDFVASMDSPAMGVIFLIFVIILDIIAFRSVRRYSQEDLSI